MNFYETNQGRHFFNVQLPQLIHALQNIAEALNKPDKPPLQVPVKMAPDFLTELYYGNLEPGSKAESSSTRLKTKEIAMAQDQLKKQLSGADFMAVDSILSLQNERSVEVSALSFQNGFRTAMQMMVAGLSNPKPAENNPGGEADE